MYTKHRWESDRYYNFGYVQYLPKDFDPSKKYPLIFFLHGSGERGEDLDHAMRHGYMKYVREEGKEYPFIFIALQCPDGKYWGCYTESMLAFLDWITETLPVDPDRVSVTGCSMGGTGSWMLAMADPERFAAVAPVCGTGIYWNARVLTKVPIFMYHGDCDTVVPVEESVNMYKAVNGLGGTAKLHLCYGVAHNAWDEAYGNDELWQWMVAQKRMPNC